MPWQPDSGDQKVVMQMPDAGYHDEHDLRDIVGHILINKHLMGKADLTQQTCSYV